MPQRNFTDKEQPTSTTLRRSPRFLPKDEPDSENPKTPDAKPRKNPSRTVLKKKLEVSKSSTRSKTSRRSPRFKNGADVLSGVGKSGRNIDVRNDCMVNIERRVTRGSTCAKPDRSGKETMSLKRKGSLSVSVNLEKRITRSGLMTAKRALETGNGTKCLDMEVLNGEVKAKNRSGIAKVSMSTLGDTGNTKDEEDDDTGKKQKCLKMKRTQGNEDNCIVDGWTKEQEMSLQRAYYGAKATPNIWKRIARMVPGKSAQACFDKIHSDFLTPPQPRLRSRAKKMNSSSLSPCATKLLLSTEKNTKKQRYRKPKTNFSQKTMRQLLQKQYDIDRDTEADLFNVLESSTDPTARVFCQDEDFSTPERNQEGLGYLKKCRESSTSGHKKSLSRLSGSSTGTLFSPPVLKPIKNKALHDRYIDQLHCREAKRKAASFRTARGKPNENDSKDDNIRKMDAIKAAKNALIFEARDAISQYQNLQSCAMNSFNDDYDDDENHSCNDEDEDEDEDMR